MPISQIIEIPSPQPAAGQSQKTYRYEAISELLREARLVCEGAGPESLAHLLDAAYRISQACCSAISEVEWHKEAYSQAEQRQLYLLNELNALIGMLTTQDRQRAASPEYERLVQCIRDLLKTAAASNRAKSPAGAAALPTTVACSWPNADDADALPKTSENGSMIRPSLAIYFLSPFRVLLDEQPVAGWPNCKGKSIFKYLVTHRDRPIPKEVLMEAFWPEGDPDAARNNLNVAIYGLRKSLSKNNANFSYVLFQDDCYLLNPELDIWVDSETFLDHVQKAKVCESRGDQAAAIREYRAAETIYQSEFLVEDRYEDWLIAVRQKFQDIYLAVMTRLSCHYFDQDDYETCVTMCSKALAVDAYNEEQHRRLMRCYSLMDYAHLALRQFHLCRETLARDLNIMPGKETMQLFEQIRQRQTT